MEFCGEIKKKLAYFRIYEKCVSCLLLAYIDFFFHDSKLFIFKWRRRSRGVNQRNAKLLNNKEMAGLRMDNYINPPEKKISKYITYMHAINPQRWKCTSRSMHIASHAVLIIENHVTLCFARNVSVVLIGWSPSDDFHIATASLVLIGMGLILK